MKRDDRGVSEIVGYVIILAIILISISMVYVETIPVLQETEETEHLNNVQRAMVTLQANIDEMVNRGVPRRGTEIRLRSGNLRLAENESALIVVNSSDISNLNSDVVRSAVPIVYTIDDRDVVYENGALIRAAGNGSRMVRNAGWKVNDDRVMLDIIDSRLRGIGRTVGDGTALIRMAKGASKTESVDLTSSDTVNITVKSEYSQAWATYFRRFEDRPGFSLDHDPDEGRVEMNFDAVPGQELTYTRTNILMSIA